VESVDQSGARARGRARATKFRIAAERLSLRTARPIAARGASPFLDAVFVEDDTIVIRYATDFLQDAHDFVLIVIADSQEIQIAGRAERIFKTLRKKHRSLQNEAVAILGLTQAIEKALKNMVVEQQIEGLAALL
jgi:hypothetical protein